MPPARAIAIAMSDSVTVSIAAAMSGTLSSMPRVKRDFVVHVARMNDRMAGDEQDVVEGERDVGANPRAAVRTRVIKTHRPAVRLGRASGP